jgi:hypothetical protein
VTHSARLLVAALLLIPATAGAQRASISGVVRDASNDQPISGASVRFPEAGRVAVTDSLGRFELSNLEAGEHRWVIERVGYARWEAAEGVGDGDRYTIRLLPVPIVLEAVTVQADRLAERRRRYGGHVRVLGAAEIAGSAGPTMAEVVRYRALLGPTVCPGMGGSGYALASTGPLCIIGRSGRPEPVQLFIDEQPIMGGDEAAVLSIYAPHEIFAVEAYDGGRIVRVYTNYYIEHNRSRLGPVIRRF